MVAQRAGARPGARWLVLAMVLSLFAGTAVLQQAHAAEAVPALCTSPGPGESMFITEDCVDPRFNHGYVFIELDEFRDSPVPHRVVYGGFRGTDARFSIFFPSAEEYEGRFFQGPTHQFRVANDLVLPNEALFAFESGAYVIETNNGGYENCLSARENWEGRCDPTVAGYRVAAATAKFSRQLAKQIYGTDARPFGYIYGGSGGAYQTVSAAERTKGVWDGFIPFVMGDPAALLHHFTLRAHASRVIGDKLADVVDAMRPGGSGDPYATLDAEQAAALREITKFGYPLKAWTEDGFPGPMYLTGEYIKLNDPTYTEDFWSKPGYLGYEDSLRHGPLSAARIQHRARVTAVAPNTPAPVPPVPPIPYEVQGPSYQYLWLAGGHALPPKVFVVDSLPTGDLRGAWIEVESGASAGLSCPLSVRDARNGIIECGGGSDPKVARGIGPGDRIRIDNSWALAYETVARHDLPPAEWGVPGYEQFRKKNGKPIYPQRPVSALMDAAPRASGSIQSGNFHGKMIVMNTLEDPDAYAYPAEWYRRQAAKHGRDGDLRVWFTDHANHGGPYGGVLEQALRDLAAWVEEGTAPATMNYTLNEDNQIQLPASAVERGGIQPVVDLRVGGGKRIEIAAGDSVTMRGTITAPPGTGKVICAEWDPEGSGSFNTANGALPPALFYDPSTPFINVSTVPNPNCEAGGEQETVELTHTYSEPGTYFATLKGTTQRNGDTQTRFARPSNIDQVRIVVR